MGHEVQISGRYEYCLGCGRTTKAKHILSARIIDWRRVLCKPVIRMTIYREKNHDIIFEEWWKCTNYKAQGPQLNKIKCTHHIVGKRSSGDDDDEDDDNNKRRKTNPTE
eukprot:7743195-Heterocapsa_arctica.AAC.1